LVEESVRAQGRGDAFAGRGVQVSDDDFVAFGVEVRGYCFADAGAGACHNGYGLGHDEYVLKFRYACLDIEEIESVN